MPNEPREFESGDRVHIGGAQREFVELRVLSRSSAADYWDGNWLACEVSVVVGGFRGRFEASLRTDEFLRFEEEVRKLHETLNGTAEFAAMEEQVRLELLGDGRGHVQCHGKLRDVAGTGNQLSFSLTLDQTQLSGTVAQLTAVLSRFPVRGNL
jgi:hypothetical protein